MRVLGNQHTVLPYCIRPVWGAASTSGWNGCFRSEFFSAGADAAVFYGLIFFAGHSVDDDGVYSHRDRTVPIAPSAGNSVITPQSGDSWSFTVPDIFRNGADVR